MTKLELRNRIARVKGRKVLDPWGTWGEVWYLERDSVWLIYPGMIVPFERSLAECALAHGGILRKDPSQQWIKQFKTNWGISVTLNYEPIREKT